MKSIRNITICISAFMLAAAIISCSDSESKLSPLLKHTTVVINLGMPPENPTAYDNTILNKIRRFFVPDAIAQSAPATFSNILVRVSGPDIGIIEQDFGPLGTISLDVPAGSLRQFEVIASVSPLDPSGAASFRGTATANLPEGETVSIPVVMTLFEARLVIPDFFNQRVVKINSMSGDGWVELNGADLGLTFPFEPYDVDFDARGRIYITNNFPSTGGDVVIRIDNMSATTYKPIGNGLSSGLFGIGIDRSRNFVYYSTGTNTLRRCGLDGTGDTLITISGATISALRGIDIDQATGSVYLACNLGSVAAIPSVALFTISGTTATFVKSQPLSGVGMTSWDVVVKPPAVYVTQAVFTIPPDPSNRVTRFDMGLITTVATAPFLIHNPSVTQDFFGPSRFIAPMNQRLTVIDEAQNSQSFDRLTGFDDISGAGWSTFGSTGSGVGQFFFYAFPN